ncbi:MAG: hypothetical protein ABL983_02605 [Nitrospira sp.]
MHWSLDVTSPIVLALLVGAAFFAFLVPPLFHALRHPSRLPARNAPRFLNLCGAHATPNSRRTLNSPTGHKDTHTLPSR